MWIPQSKEDLLGALPDLQESASLEFKQALPVPAKNTDVAVDVAAMTTDGGVIIYGIAEDKTSQTFSPMPIPLQGVVERLSSIVQSKIAGPPTIEAYTFEDSPGWGFLVVVIPPSPTAPHMVEVRGEMRFDGRSPGGNRQLTQADVDRIYERRQRWALNRQSLLDETVTALPRRELTPQAGST